MRRERLFDLARIHVEPGDDDHLLLTVDDRVVPVGIDRRDVARIEPAVADREGCLVGTVVVAVHQLWATQDQLARLADRHLAQTSLAVDDLAFDIRIRNADRAGLLLALAIQRVAVRHRRRLGQPVTLDQVRAREGDELLVRLDQQRRRAAHAGVDRAQIVLRRQRRVDDRVVDPRRAAEGLRLVLGDVLQNALELELRLEEHRARRLDGLTHHHREAIHVEERHDRHPDAVAVLNVDVPRAALQRVRDERAVRQHRALAHAGRAAGVLEQRDVVLLHAGVERLGRSIEHLAERHRARIALERLAVAVLFLLREREEGAEDERHLLLDVGDDHVLHVGALASRLRDRVEPRQGDERLRAGVSELVTELGHGVERVAWNDDRAGAQRAVERHDELRRVRQQDRDTVALLHAELAQAVGESPRVIRDRFVGPLRVEEDRRDRVRIALRGIVEEGVHRGIGVDQRRRDALVVVAGPRPPSERSLVLRDDGKTLRHGLPPRPDVVERIGRV